MGTYLDHANRTESRRCRRQRRRRSSRCGLRCRGGRIQCCLRRRNGRIQVLVLLADSRRHQGCILATLILNRSATLIPCSICSRNRSRNRSRRVILPITRLRLRLLHHHYRFLPTGHLFLTASSRGSSRHRRRRRTMVSRERFHRAVLLVLLRQEDILRRSMGAGAAARIRQLVDCPCMPTLRRFSMRRSTRISDTRRRTRRGRSRIQMLHSMRTLVLGLGRARAVIVLPRFLRRFQLLLRHRLASIGRMPLRRPSHKAAQTRSMWKFRLVVAKTVEVVAIVAITVSPCRP